MLAIFAIFAWPFLSLWLAFQVTRVTRHRLLKVPVLVLSVLVLVALPWLDEIIGKFQFDSLCRESEEVQIFGTIPVGEDLYFPDGRWKLSSIPRLPFNEFNRVREVYDSLVRYESIRLQISVIAMPISGSENRILDRKTGRLLASYRTYGTRGGWISRNFEKPSITKDQCLPRDFSIVGQRILPYRKDGSGK